MTQDNIQRARSELTNHVRALWAESQQERRPGDDQSQCCCVLQLSSATRHLSPVTRRRVSRYRGRGISGHHQWSRLRPGRSLCMVRTCVSVVNIIMGSRWAALATLLALSLAQVTVEATMWSNIGFMTNQDQAPANKRSAEDAHVGAVLRLVFSASHYPTVSGDVC